MTSITTPLHGVVALTYSSSEEKAVQVVAEITQAGGGQRLMPLSMDNQPSMSSALGIEECRTVHNVAPSLHTIANKKNTLLSTPSAKIRSLK